MAAKKGEKRDHHLHVGKGFHFCFSIFHKSSFSVRKRRLEGVTTVCFHCHFVPFSKAERGRPKADRAKRL